jgi:hypothetical protein
MVRSASRRHVPLQLLQDSPLVLALARRLKTDETRASGCLASLERHERIVECRCHRIGRDGFDPGQVVACPPRTPDENRCRRFGRMAVPSKGSSASSEAE